MSEPAAKPKRKRVNIRRPEVMELVQAEVERHYRSPVVEHIRQKGGEVSIGDTTLRLAQEFGFCYGVERAIDLAYASRRVFEDQRIFLIGDHIDRIVHRQGSAHRWTWSRPRLFLQPMTNTIRS